MFPPQGAPEVLLDPNKDIMAFIMALYKLHKIGRKSTRSSLGGKHKPYMFRMILPGWLSKTIQGFCNMVYHIVCEFRGKIGKIN